MRIRHLGALVTGGSRGLGAALGHELARRGMRVVLVARRQAGLDEVVAAIRREGGEAYAVVGDVADKRDVFAIAASAAELIGQVDVLIHNASTLGVTPLRLLADTECEDFEQVLQTNLLAPFRLTKVMLGGMVFRERGVVVHVSSDAAVEAYARWGAYGVSKAALDHLSRTFAAELAGTGVTFFSVDPGEMNTAMHAAAMPEADLQSLARPEVVARAIADMVSVSIASGEGGSVTSVLASGARVVARDWSHVIGGDVDERSDPQT